MSESYGTPARAILARGNWPLVVVDTVVVVAVMLAGELQHRIDPVANPLRVADTLLPFLVGWLVFAGVSGLYARTDRPIGADLRLLVVAWFAGANVGLTLRSSPYFHGGVSWPFGVVVTGTVLVVLVAWRVAYAGITRE
jgi:hypothetical protein